MQLSICMCKWGKQSMGHGFVCCLLYLMVFFLFPHRCFDGKMCTHSTLPFFLVEEVSKPAEENSENPDEHGVKSEAAPSI